TEQNPAVTISQLGSYNVTLVATNDNGNNQIIKSKIIEVVGYQLICTADSSSSLSGKLYDSGGANDRYSSNEMCSFLITGDCADSINISLTSIYTEASQDFIKIYDGKDKNALLLLSKSGQSNNAKITASSGNALVTFSSNSFTNYDGFNLTWDKKNVVSILTNKSKYYKNTAISFSTNKAVQSYYWDFGDGTFSSEGSPNHIYTQAGNYAVTLHITTSNGCSSKITKNITVESSIGISLPNNANINVSPNPSSGAFFIELPDQHTYNFMKVYSILGEVLLQQDLAATEDKIAIELDNMSDGIYYLIVGNQLNSHTATLILVK
ncbi:MAG: PKD domain-containing protein, partial [Flavobacteriales bacterium]